MVMRSTGRSLTRRHPPGSPARAVLRTVAAGIGAGAAGTAVMTTTAHLHRTIHVRRRGALAPGEILDYDDSDHVVVAAGTILQAVSGWAPTTPRARRGLFLLVHWGYGSVVGVAHRGLRVGLGGEPAAGAAFFVGCQAMALSLFPALGGTPPPWRWRRDLLVTSLVQHAIYAGAVATAARALTRPARR